MDKMFPHESVDEDIDRLTNHWFSPSLDSDAQLVHGLRHIYKEDADLLKRVWRSLEQYDRLQYSSQHLSTQFYQRYEASSQIIPLKRSSSKKKYPANQLFTVLAAAIVGLFIVSSLAWILERTYPAAPGAPKNVPAIPMITSSSLNHFVRLTVHNDKSNETNYFTITYKGNDGKTEEYVACQAIPPLSWVDVKSSPDMPIEIPTGQTAWLRYFHSTKCNPSSMLLSVGLPIPAEPTYGQCWFNPDNITTPNWSGCVRFSQTLAIHWY